MSLYILRIGLSKEYYPEIAHIFGLDYYCPKESGEDDYSKRLIYFYKYGKDLQFFLEKLINLFKLRFDNDLIKFDYITLYPTREKDKVNPNMKALIEELSKTIKIPYKQIIRRNRTIKPSHEFKTFEERINNIKDSIDVLEDVKGKNIIIVDNVSTTGTSLIDVTNLLLDKGAEHVACICLGISIKEKQGDWVDLNKTLKYSRIIDICTATFISKEKREKWKTQA